MMSDKTGCILLEKRGHIALITLNDPGRLNALTVKMGEEFERVILELSADSEIRCAVVTGAGRAFSAGGDLEFLQARIQSSPKENKAEMLRFYRRFLSILNAPFPVIAALNGHAIGAGFSFAMACDFRVVSKKAKLGATFVSLGLHPGMGASYLLPHRIPQPCAADLLITGRKISGEESISYGICLEIIEPGDVLACALKKAEEVAAQSPAAVQATVKTLRPPKEILDKALEHEAAEQAKSYASADYAKGLAAIQKRESPTF